MARSPIAFVFPGDINTRTGGYRYDKRIVDGLAANRWPVECVSLDGDFPFPSSEQQALASQKLAQLPSDTLTVVDGLAYSAMPEVIARHSDRLDFIALIHHPLSLETGLTAIESALLEKRETEALRFARHVITTSQLTAESLAHYQVEPMRITPVLPGTDTAPLSPHSDVSPWNLLCVATITARKGHEVLVTALSNLAHLDWQLTCAGSTEREPETYHQLQSTIDNHQLMQRISFVGEVDDERLSGLYQQADLMVLASWHEGYGMVLDEAIACGLPIVCTRGGAMQHTVPKGAGILVNTGEPLAFAQALDTFMTSGTCRQQLREAATKARQGQRSWQQAISEFCKALKHD